MLHVQCIYLLVNGTQTEKKRQGNSQADRTSTVHHDSKATNQSAYRDEYSKPSEQPLSQRRNIFSLEGALISSNVCGVAVAGRIRCFIGISRDAEICHGFPPPQAALVTVASGEKGLLVVWCNSGEVMLRLRGREILIGMITY